MVQDGWISGAVNRTNVVVHSHDSGTELNVSLANGSVPSGALIRSLIVIASDDLEGGLSAGDVIGPAPDIIQGWGRPNLSRIVDLTEHDAESKSMDSTHLQLMIRKCSLNNGWALSIAHPVTSSL